MTTAQSPIARALRTQYPHLNDDAIRTLAAEIAGVVQKATASGLDMSRIQLLVKGGRHTPLGDTLRTARENAHLTHASVCRQTEWSASKLLRIENGTNGISTTDLKALLLLYGITDQTIALALIEQARADRQARHDRS